MIERNIIDYVKQACAKPENVLPAFFDEQLCIVADYAEKLCGILNGGKEVSER